MNRSVRTALLRSASVKSCEHVIEWRGKRVASLKTAFGAATRKAGLEGVSPHVLRHTAAVWMAGGGSPMDKIAQFLGHSSVETTRKIYARYAPEHLTDEAEALDLSDISVAWWNEYND